MNTCTLIIPAYNEAKGIVRCLDSILGSPLPENFSWREWVILDGGSDDGTSDLAAAWADNVPRITLRVARSPVRRGLIADMAEVHKEAVGKASNQASEILVVVEADTVANQGTLAGLLQPFNKIEDLAATFGYSHMVRSSWKSWPSTFQGDVSEVMARLEDPAVPRAMGRIFAYRVHRLADFTWTQGCGGADAQFCAYLAVNGLRTMFSPEARVLSFPSSGYRDFSLQTYRCRASVAAAKEKFPAWRMVEPPFRVKVKAVICCAARSPQSFLAYVIARVIGWPKGRRIKSQYQDVWVQSKSTKQ